MQITDFFTEQYNKSVRKKKKSKSKKKKSKSKLKRASTPKFTKSGSKNVRGSKTSSDLSETLEISKSLKPQQINLPKPNKPVGIKLKNTTPNKSKRRKKSNQFIPMLRDDCSDKTDIQSTISAFSNISNDASIDSMAYAKSESAISSLLSSPTSSAGTTPNTDAQVINVFSDIKPKEMNKALNAAAYHSKYGGYPFKRKREQYIKQRFTGVIRIGHRYLLRDGRVGVVRYINATRFAPGTWIGFELDKPEGEHDGIVNNIRYFTCANMYGTFVKKSQIAQYIARDTTKSLSKEHLRFINTSK